MVKRAASRVHEQGKQQAIAAAERCSLRLSHRTRDDIAPMDELTLAYIADKNPISKMKLSDKAVQYMQLEQEQFYSDYCHGLSILMKQGKRQTLDMGTVHTGAPTATI